jgi:hypothetical protein
MNRTRDVVLAVLVGFAAGVLVWAAIALLIMLNFYIRLEWALLAGFIGAVVLALIEFGTHGRE